MLQRPRPPLALTVDPIGQHFVPAPDLERWARRAFIEPFGPLTNADHAHLEHASIGMLWTNCANVRQMRTIVGTCELGKPFQGSRWTRARATQQIAEWFGEVPDFVLTFDALYADVAGDAEFCALVEHELYHAGQDRDEFGAPAFHKSGRPKLAIRGHDVEEFVGVVRRYGVGAAAGETMALVEAAKRGPQIARANIAQACGVCVG